MIKKKVQNKKKTIIQKQNLKRNDIEKRIGLYKNQRLIGYLLTTRKDGKSRMEFNSEDGSSKGLLCQISQTKPEGGIVEIKSRTLGRL